MKIAELSLDSTKDNQKEISKLEIQRINIAIFKGNFKQAQLWIKDAKRKVQPNTLEEAKLYDSEGELYYAISDIEIAELKWNEAFRIMNGIPGIDSIYIAQVIARMARIANFNIQSEKALSFAKKAVQILERNKKQIIEVDAGDIYREYAFALKISVLRKDNTQSLAPIRRELFTAIRYTEQWLGKDNYKNGQLLHDIGNTYNDEALRYKGISSRHGEVKKYVDSANIYYNKAIDFNRKYYGSSDRISVTYFVKGLLLQYNFLKDSFDRSLFYYNQSIKELVPSFIPVSQYDNPVPDSTVFNKSGVVQSIIYKGGILDELYRSNHDTTLLKPIYNQYLAAARWYELMLKSYKSEEQNLTSGIYEQVPYPLLANISLELYRHTRNRSLIEEIYNYLELKNYYTLLSSIHDKNRLLNSDITSAVTPLETVQEKLDNKTAILEFFDGNSVAIITHSKIEFASSSFLNVERLRTAIQKNDFKQYRISAYESYLNGFKPLEKYLVGIEHLVIVPNAAIALMPFDALLTDTTNCQSFLQCKNRYLINQYTFQFAFSSSLWSKEKEQPSNVSLLSFSPGYSKHATLKFNQDLVSHLQEKYTGVSYQNALATKTNFIAASQNNNDVIHLAVHGEADMQNPELSKLIFAREVDSSYLAFADIRKLHLQSPLLVLAACKTQEGRNYSGEGLLNFPRAFALAGVSSTVSSIWSVDDKATSNLLKYFYENLDAGTSKAYALRRAKLSYLENCSEEESSPLYWSGFILNGNDSPINISKKHQYLPWILSVVGFVFLGVFYWKRKSIA